MRKTELITAIEAKTTKAKPMVLAPFKKFLMLRTKTDLKNILKTIHVSQDGLDITFRY